MGRVRTWAGVIFGVTALLLVPAAQAAPDVETMTFDEALRIAEARNADVLSAKNDLLLADVQHMLALSAILPQLNLNANAAEAFAGAQIVEYRTTNTFVPFTNHVTYGPFRDFYTNPYSAPNFTANLQASQLVFDGGRWWTVIAQADDITQQYKAALRNVENNTRQSVAHAFYTLEKQSRSVRTFSSQIQLDEEQLDRVNRLLKAGAGKLADVAAVERNVASDRAELARRKLLERQAMRTLNLALGRPPNQLIGASVDIEARPEDVLTTTMLPPRDSLVQETLTRRPELQIARANLDVDRKNVSIARADYYPVVQLGASYSRNSRRPDRVWAADPTQDYYAGLNLGLTWNLFNGRATTANVQKAEIQVTHDEIQYDGTARSVLQDLDNALDNVKVTSEIYQLSLQTISAAEEALRLARGNYEQGRGTLLELRDAEVQRTLARQSADEARLDFEIAREDLRHAVGVDVFDGENQAVKK
jgi:outer membrane protein TolC